MQWVHVLAIYVQKGIAIKKIPINFEDRENVGQTNGKAQEENFFF
jgi:hypothetical protein